MVCEEKVNDFLATIDDGLSFTICHCLQSIQQAEIAASIINRDAHRTTGTPAETVIHLDWIFLQFHITGSLHSSKTKALNSVITVGQINLYIYAHRSSRIRG